MVWSPVEEVETARSIRMDFITDSKISLDINSLLLRNPSTSLLAFLLFCFVFHHYSEFYLWILPVSIFLGAVLSALRFALYKRSARNLLYCINHKSDL